MLVNLSNHSVKNWSEPQLNEAMSYFGEVVDLQFPDISLFYSIEELNRLAKLYRDKVIRFYNKSNDYNNAVQIMGEMTFVYRCLLLLKERGIMPLPQLKIGFRLRKGVKKFLTLIL